MRAKLEPVYALLVVAFVWESLFGRWLPERIQSVLFLVVFLLELALIAAGWWYWGKGRNAINMATWRKDAALVGVAANTAAVVIPIGSLLYMIFYPFVGLRMHMPMVDGQLMVLTCFAFSLCGVIAGVLAPPRSRVVTVLGGLIIALAVAAIPMGGL